MRAAFYALTPAEAFCGALGSTPNFLSEALPVILLLAAVEALYIRAKGRDDQWRLHEVVVNISSMGLANGSALVLFRGAELGLYTYVYENWRVATLPWDSRLTYLYALLAVEFAAYWWHRAAHEVALLWSAHHVHHSSEDMNMFVAPRVSIFRPFYKWAFYVPLVVLGLPPATMVVHMQLGVIYTAWTHNDTIPKLSKVVPYLGHAIEFVMVTPSHHRVHHGANKYCLDKNYGMVLIVYDRLFSTFAEEREDEPIVYGTLKQRDSYDIIGVQVEPAWELWAKVRSMRTLGDMARALFYGPGWVPGAPRLGREEDVPCVKGRKKHQFNVPAWFSFYLLVNALSVFCCYLEVNSRYNEMDKWQPIVLVAYLALAYAAVGALFDGRRHGPRLEVARLLLFLLLSRAYPLFEAPAVNQAHALVCGLSLLLSPAVASASASRAARRAAAEEEKAE